MYPCKHGPALALVVAALLLGGCAFTPPSDLITNPDWQISGKIGIREPDVHATVLLFKWQQQDDRYLIHLFNTLGRLELTLSGDSTFARAESSDGKVAHADNAEELLHKITGWSFPVTNARYWLQGQTTGNESDIHLNEHNKPATFSTSTWQVALDRYKDVDGKILPHRIKLDGNDLTLTLIVKDHAAFTP